MTTFKAYPIAKNLNQDAVRLIQKNTTHQYINDGLRDDFPARMLTYVSGSVIARAAVDKRKEFLQGAEIVGQGLDEIANPTGETRRQVIEKCIQDYALFDRFFALVIPNKRASRSLQVYHVPAEYVRMGLEDEMGVSDYVYANPFINTEDGRQNAGKHYPIWSGDRARMREEMRTCYERFKHEYAGHMLVCQNLSPYNRFYSRPGGAYALEWLEADFQQGQFIASNLRTNFFLGGILYVAGDPMEPVDSGQKDKDGNTIFITNEERTKRDLSEAFSGGQNAGSILVQYFTQQEQIGKFERPEVDRLHEVIAGIDQKILDKISLAFGVPKVLLGQNTPGQLGANQQMIDAFNQLNQFTKKDRAMIEREFSRLFETPIEIIPLSADTLLPDIVFQELRPNEKREYIREQFGLEIEDLTPEEIASMNPNPQPNAINDEDADNAGN